MKKFFSYFGILFFVSLTSMFFLTGCVKESAKPVVISEPGYYEDKGLGISLTYPADVFSVENDLLKGEVVNSEGEQRLPAIVLRIDDITEGVALNDIGNWLLEDFKIKYPDSDRFKVMESKMVKLQTGMDANSTLLKWRYQGTVPLYTACVSAYKDNKAVYVFTTSVPGQPPADILTKISMALQVTP
jgi:hypothetical protein